MAEEKSMIPVSTGDTRLDVLLIDYQIARDDDRSSVQQLLSFLGVGLGLLTVLAAFVLRSCGFESITGLTLAKIAGCRPGFPAGLFAFVPLTIGALLGYVAISGVSATHQNYYMRELELRILEHLGIDKAGPELRSPSYVNMMAKFKSQTRGPRSSALIFLVLYLCIGFLSLAITVICLVLTHPTSVRVLAGVVYLVVAAAILRLVMIGSYSSSRTWQRIGPDLSEELERTRRRRGAPLDNLPARRLAGYLLLPRPAEMVVKSLFVVGGAVFGALLFGYDAPRPLWLNIAIAVVITDYLAYQARYTLNDLAGAVTDAEHPGLAGSRFPIRANNLDPKDAAVALFTAIGRILAAVLLAFHFYDGGQRIVLCATSVLVVILGVVYDRLRDAESMRARNDRVGLRSLTKFSPGACSVILLVGVGYPLRVASGLVVGAETLPGVYLFVAIVTFWLFGQMFVTMTWVVDTIFFFGPSNKKDRYRLAEPIKSHPHYFPLARQAYGSNGSCLLDEDSLAESPLIPIGWRQIRDDPGQDWRILLAMQPLKSIGSTSWWGSTMALSVGAATALALIPFDARSWMYLVVPVNSLLAWVAYRQCRYWVVPISTCIPLVLLMFFFCESGAPFSKGLSAIPLLAITTTYVIFNRLDPRSERANIREVAVSIGLNLVSQLTRPLELLVGKGTAEAIRQPLRGGMRTPREEGKK